MILALVCLLLAACTPTLTQYYTMVEPEGVSINVRCDIPVRHCSAYPSVVASEFMNGRSY